jgi:virginiamycin B lyase
MKRALVAGAALLLAGCGGGGHAAAPVVLASATAKGGTQSGTMSLTFGTQTGATSKTRKPLFVSSNATSAIVDINNGSPQTFDVSATSALCTTVSSVRTCSIPLTAPVGAGTIGVALMASVAGSPTMLGQGSNSLTVVAGTNFNVTVGINAVVAGVNALSFSTGTTLSLTFGTPGTATGTPIFNDPANTPITGSGNVPNFLTPVTIVSSDPHVTVSPTALTTPGQTFTITYDGSAAVASTVTLTVKSGSTTLVNATAFVPGLLVTRYNLAAITAPGTVFPEQIVVGPDNNIWWTEEVTNRIGRIAPGAAAVAAPNPAITYFPNTSGGTATGLAVGCDGNLWYSNSGQVITRMTPAGGVPGIGPATITVGAPGSQVGRLAADLNGNIWYINSGVGFSQVAYVDCTSFVTNTFGSTPTANSLYEFAGLALGADKAMWFTEDEGTRQIGRITTPANGVAGTYTEYPIANTSPSTYPTDITKGSDGNMWFSVFGSVATTQFFANFTPNVTINISEYPNVIDPNIFANLVTIFNGTDGNVWMAEGGGAVKITPAAPSIPAVEFFTDNGQTSMVNCISGTTPDGKLWCTAYGSGVNPGFTTTTDAILTWMPR